MGDLISPIKKTKAACLCCVIGKYESVNTTTCLQLNQACLANLTSKDKHVRLAAKPISLKVLALRHLPQYVRMRALLGARVNYV